MRWVFFESNRLAIPWLLQKCRCWRAASDAPHWRINEELNISVEHALSPVTVQELRRRGHNVT
jgi:hypothetical protein